MVKEKEDKAEDKINTTSDKGEVKNFTSIRCAKCGDIKAVRKEVFLKRAEKFGSIETLLKRYKFRYCRKGQAKSGIRCSKCGDVKGVRKDVYQQRIVRYGTEENLLAKYLCRKCRKIVKHNKKISARKFMLQGDNDVS